MLIVNTSVTDVEVDAMTLWFQMVGVNMRGELTVTAEEEKDLLEHSLIQKMAKTMKISSESVRNTSTHLALVQ